MSSVCEEAMLLALAPYACYGFIHRYMTVDKQVAQVRRSCLNGAFVGAAFSASDTERTLALVATNPDILIGDIAHGDSQVFHDSVKLIRDNGFGGVIASANIVTVDAADRALSSGCNALRVGLGSGSVCETRTVAGVGRNTLKAISEIHAAFPETPILACGGIRNSGDIVKCLASGATSVLVGRLFATCDESPAQRVGSKVVYAGMASYFAEQQRAKSDSGPWRQAAHEGKHELLDGTGPVADTILRLVGGIRAGFAYVGARNLRELWEKAKFENA